MLISKYYNYIFNALVYNTTYRFSIYTAIW